MIALGTLQSSRCLLAIGIIAASPLFSADGPRLLEQGEATTTLSLLNQRLPARLWMGRGKATTRAGIVEPFEVVALHVPGTELLWWRLRYAVGSLASSLQDFKDNFHCAAGRTEIVCFWSRGTQLFIVQSDGRSKRGMEGLDAVVSPARLDGSGLAATMERRIANLTGEAVRETFDKPVGAKGEHLDGISELEPLMKMPNLDRSEAGTFHRIRSAKPTSSGWELEIENGVTHRKGLVTLDDAFRPVSGKMID
jgi:hypothetical protein